MHPFSNLDAPESFSVCKILQLFHFEMYSLLFIAFWITPSEIMANLENCCNATMPPSGYSQGSDLAGGEGSEPQRILQDTTSNTGWMWNRCMHQIGLVY